MAKKILSDEIAAVIASGAATKVEGNKFVTADGQPLQIRSMESVSDPLEVGDVITIPTDYQVLSMPVGDTQACFIYAECKCADGSERNIRFFPNSLAKVYFPLDENRRRMPKVKTGGAVAHWLADCQAAGKTMDDAMKELAGKKIKVSAKDAYTVFKYQSTTETQTTNAYTYDWAE